MRLIRYIIPAIAAAAFASCEKEIDFKYHDIPEQQVIECLLTQNGVSAKLTKTVATDEPFPKETVTDASVIINDVTAARSFTLTSDSSGVFTCQDLRGEPGHEYELMVTMGDQSYASSCRMLEPSKILSAEFSWIKMPYDDVAVLKVQFTEDKDPYTNYWMRVFRNGEIYDWQAISSHNAVDGVVRGMMMTSRKDADEEDDDTVLRDGDVIDIEVLPVSRDIADYLNSLNNGDYNGNLLFTGSYCLGYFLAAPVAETQIIYHPDQIH